MYIIINRILINKEKLDRRIAIRNRIKGIKRTILNETIILTTKREGQLNVSRHFRCKTQFRIAHSNIYIQPLTISRRSWYNHQKSNVSQNVRNIKSLLWKRLCYILRIIIILINCLIW